MRSVIMAVLEASMLMPVVNAALYDPAEKPFVEIAANGRPRAQIVVPAEATYLERFAASELQTYLERMSGARLPVGAENEKAPAGYRFFIGATRKALQAGVKPDAQTMGRDGFALRSVPGGLVIVGRSDLGTLFGVYELLERYFDVRWFMPGDIGEHIPKAATLRMGTVNITFKPSFAFRWVGTGEWALHQRMNVRITAGGRDVGVKWQWHFHTFSKLIPTDKYYDEHPEYFALVNGKRVPKQLCTSNPDVVREVAENLIAVLDANPDIEIITLSPNDGGGFCECERCAALDEPGRDWFGKHSRRLAIFYNKVARLVKEKHPKVLIKVGAYASYCRPPLESSWRPEDNLVFQLCHLYFCHNHPLGSGLCKPGETYQPAEEFQPNQEFCKILDEWRRLCPHLFVYEYYTIGGMARAKLPWPLLHTMRSDIPYYRDHGVKGFYTQLGDDTWHRLGLNYYVAAKLCWNADLDVDALLDDYFDKFYGPAAEPMKDYFMAMEDAMQAWNGCASYGLQGVRGLRTIGPKIFTPAVVDFMSERLSKAGKLTADDKLRAQRVALARRMYDETKEALAGIPPR